jgi:hypothetical protein
MFSAGRWTAHPALRPAARHHQPSHPRSRPAQRRRSTPAARPGPVVLPEPLADLVLRLAATRQGHATTGDQGTSPWLLPGGRPGQPISPYRLNERLHQIGIRPGPARSTALFQLATELPAAILARMLGIHIDVAWQQASNGDWTTYAADIARGRQNA